MYPIDRIKRYSSIDNYKSTTRKVKDIDKDEKDQRQNQQREESFKDIFEKTQAEEKKVYDKK